MKLKSLITPVIIILMIIAIAGFIFPKAFEVKDSFENLKKAKQSLAQAMEKRDKAKKLSQELMTNAEKQNILLRYIPNFRQEEEIINNLNAISVSEGLSVISLSLMDKVVSDSIASVKNTEKNSEPQSVSGTLKTVNVELALSGSYEQVKSFLNKLSGMQRSVEVISLNISRITERENVNPNRLQANMNLGFNYLDKINAVNVNSEILNSGEFNMSVIDKITETAKTDFSDINIGQVGKNNPFIP